MAFADSVEGVCYLRRCCSYSSRNLISQSGERILLQLTGFCCFVLTFHHVRTYKITLLVVKS